MKIASEIRALTAEAEAALADIFRDIDEIARTHTEHVLDCFREAEVSESLFTPSTGYGYGDRGRDTIDELAAAVFRAESGFMRPSLLSGTHTLTVALFGILRPGDTMLCCTGMPYDTLLDVIGIGSAQSSGSVSTEGSLRDWGVSFEKVGLKSGTIDLDGLKQAMAAYRPKMVYCQRSKGYENRPALSVREIRHAAWVVRQTADELGIPRPVFMVDNCYGEFVEASEPCRSDDLRADEAAADLMAGSLIKNPGGGMADIGGYIVGRAECVRLCGNRLTSPGVGLDVGASLGQNRNLIKGLFYAPHTVAQAMKTAHLAAYLFEKLGLVVAPDWRTRRADIVQIIECGTADGLVAFCRGIQAASPIDAHVVPYPAEMPGYADPVVMAAGAFTGGASIELSADGPLRPPYAAYMQGGLTYESGRLAVMSAANELCMKK